jgi:hypothetical protein
MLGFHNMDKVKQVNHLLIKIYHKLGHIQVDYCWKNYEKNKFESYFGINMYKCWIHATLIKDANEDYYS